MAAKKLSDLGFTIPKAAVAKKKLSDLGWTVSYSKPTPVVAPKPVAKVATTGGRGTINRGVISPEEIAKGDTRTKPTPVFHVSTVPAIYRAETGKYELKTVPQLSPRTAEDFTPATPKIVAAIGLSGVHGVSTGIKETQGLPSSLAGYSAEKQLQMIELHLNDKVWWNPGNPSETGGKPITHDAIVKMYEDAKARVAFNNSRMLFVQNHIAADIAASPRIYSTVATGDKDWDAIASFTKDVGSGAVSEGLALGISAITGGAAAPIVAPLFGLWSLAGKYAETVGAGVTGRRATQTAEFSGFVNWFGEYIELKAFGAGKGLLTRTVSDEAQSALTELGKNIALDSMPKVLARAAQLKAAAGSLAAAYAKLAFAGGAKAIAGDMIENGAQELIESLGEDLGDYINGIKVFDKESAWASLGKGVKAGIIGAVLAGATSVMAGGVSYAMDRKALGNIGSAISETTKGMVAAKVGADLSATAIESANTPEVNARLQQKIGIIDPSTMNAKTFSTVLQTQPILITAVERTGEKLNNWARTSALTKLLGGVKPNRGTYTGMDGETTHENSFIFTDVEAGFKFAAASNQESVLYGDGHGNWWFIDPRSHEIVGTANGLNFAPLGDKTRVTLAGKKGLGFSFDNVEFGVEAPASPLLNAAIGSKNDTGGEGMGFDEQGQATYYSGPDTATSGTSQSLEAAPTLGNAAKAPLGITGTSNAPSANLAAGFTQASGIVLSGETLHTGVAALDSIPIELIQKWVPKGFNAARDGAKLAEEYQRVVNSGILGEDILSTVRAKIQQNIDWGSVEYPKARAMAHKLAGGDADLEKMFVTLIAITSKTTPVKQNIENAIKGMVSYLEGGKIDVSKLSEGSKVGLAHYAAELRNHFNIGLKGNVGYDYAASAKHLGSKTGQFGGNWLGDDWFFTSDTHMKYGFYGASIDTPPTPVQKVLIAAIVSKAGEELGLSPAQSQASFWKTIATERGKGYGQGYSEAFENITDFTGEPREQYLARLDKAVKSTIARLNEQRAANGKVNIAEAVGTQALGNVTNAGSGAVTASNYQTQYGGQQYSGTGAPPTTITITAGGNPVLTNQQGQSVAVLPTLLNVKPIKNIGSQDALSLTEERWKDDINVLRNLGYLDGYTYKLLTVIRGSSTATEFAALHGLALMPDGKKQVFAPGVQLPPFVQLGDKLKSNGMTEENLNTFAILYAASRGNPVNVESMPEVNLLKQGKGTLAEKLAKVKANALTELAAYTPEQYSLLKGIMDEAHKYLTPIVNAMHSKGMPLGENLDSGAIGVDEWIDSYVSSAEPNSSGTYSSSSPMEEKHIETISHKQVTGYLNGIVNTMNHYNQWFMYNEYVKRFSTEMGYTSDTAIKGAPTFFADDGSVKWVDAPEHIKRQLTSVISRAHATIGLFNSDIYNKLMTASRELKLMTPAFAQTNLFRDAGLVLTRYGIHPVAAANTILKLIIGQSEKSSGLVGMGTPNELTGNVFTDFQNIDHAVALTHVQRIFQYIHDNVLGVSESLMRNYAFNVEKGAGKSEVEQIYSLIASSADFTVFGSSENAANIRKAWQFSQASLDVTMSWDLAIKELGTKMASDNMGTKFEGFSSAALLIAFIAAGIGFKAREKERKELQDYVSQNKVPIRIGKNIITIPEGFNQGILLENTISTIVAGMLSGDSVGEITGGLAQDVYSGIVGMIGRDGDLTLNSIASTLTPTLFEPITRVFLNTQYGGGQIDPMTWGANWTHYFKSTTNVAKTLSRQVHDLTNGAVDLSPIKMDYLIKSYLARYGTALTKLDSSGAKSAISGFMAQQFVVPVPQGIKTQAYSDWQDGYAKIVDELAQAKKGNYPMSQNMIHDFQLLTAINKLFPKQQTAQGVYALSLYGLIVLDAYNQHKKERE